MSSISSEAPSSRALRHLSNRNNVAGLYLRKKLQQMEREKDFYMSYLDKDRLDVTDFLKNLHRCDSDDLPQSKIIREELESEEDDDSEDDDSGVVRHPRRNTHTAKTAPPRLHVHRHRNHDDDDDDDDYDDDEDVVSLAEHHPRRLVQTGVPSRRQMLAQRRKEELRAMESEYEKTEVFLRKLRQDAAREELEEYRKHVTQKEFTAYLLRKIRKQADLWTDQDWGGDEEREKEGEGEEGDEGRMWARSRLDMIQSLRRNMASRVSGRNLASRMSGRNLASRMSGRHTPGWDDGYSKSRFFGASLKKLLGDAAGGRERDRDREGDGRAASAKKKSRQKSIFEITADDPPPNLLPRPAGQPDFNRSRRDTLVDTARAFGFGEAARTDKNSAPPQQPSSTPLPQVNPFSRAAMAERRRLERQAKSKPVWHMSSAVRATPSAKDDAKGTDMIRAMMQIKSRFRHKPLDDRVRDFMRDLDEVDKSRGPDRRQVTETGAEAH